jgi:hypothetical protein
MRANKLILTSLAAIGMAGAVNAGPSTFSLSMYKVAQTDNLDKLDALGSDKADFYVLLWINGKDMGRSKNVSSDVGETGWIRNLSSANRYVKIRIRLMEDDGGAEGEDDHVDINPAKGKKDLDFTYDTRTGRIYGDVNGRRGVNIHAAGEGDSDRGQLWFKIE